MDFSLEFFKGSSLPADEPATPLPLDVCVKKTKTTKEQKLNQVAHTDSANTHYINTIATEKLIALAHRYPLLKTHQTNLIGI